MEQKKDFLENLEENLMLITILVASVLTLCTFVFQFVAPDALALTKQLSFYAYGWMVYLGVGSCVKKGAFLKIELLTGKYPDSAKKFVKVVSELIMLVVCVLMCYYSFRLTMQTMAADLRNQAAPIIPLAAAYAAPAVGYGLGVIAYIQRLVKGGK